MRFFALLLLANFCLIGWNQTSAPFYHGVASGDPLQDAVIIWTRVTPSGSLNDPVPVTWYFSTTDDFSTLVDSGTVVTDQSKDFTVKVDVQNLNANAWYYYKFEALGSCSVVGRTKTAASGHIDTLRMAVVSCANYEHGYFNVYDRIASRNDIQMVLCLGDYIYEYETGGYSANISGRTNEPTNEIITLDDYRMRYSHYRLDSNLIKAHMQYPWICVWDDHESANDAYHDGAENHTDGSEGNWNDRKGFAQTAYYEWMPIRLPDTTDTEKIYRAFEFGDLVELTMLDTRLYGRDEQGAGSDANRKLLGTAQFNWLTNKLSNNTKTWNLVGQQVMMAPLEAFGIPVNNDQWDGYPQEREDLFNYIANNNIDNFVVLTGDIHTSWANDLPHIGYDDGNNVGSVGVEFVTTSVTSPGFPIGVGESLIMSMNDHIQYADLSEHGYIVLDIQHNKCQADWFYVDDIESTTFTESFAAGYYTSDGQPYLVQAPGEQAAFENSRQLVQFDETCPPDYTGIDETTYSDLIAVYPNPATTQLTLQIMSKVTNNDYEVEVLDMNGKKVFERVIPGKAGVQYFKLHLEDLQSGMYVLNFRSNQLSKSVKFIKK